jgi:hypothetical protein
MERNSLPSISPVLIIGDTSVGMTGKRACKSLANLFKFDVFFLHVKQLFSTKSSNT